jgi:hypothetical protein
MAASHPSAVQAFLSSQVSVMPVHLPSGSQWSPIVHAEPSLHGK